MKMTALLVTAFAVTLMVNTVFAQVGPPGGPPGGGGNLAAQVADHEARLGTLEGQNLDSRVSDLEDNSLQFLRTIIVSPLGPTPLDNGNELLSAANEARN